jgi:uncharacterized membrane protein YeaQ/YmgE (transglycosylase-associated protein family)/uncharacterized protein YjbJ (UPF0337 family)
MIWLFVGAFLGWLTTVIIHNRRKDLLFNIVVGIAGMFVAGYLLVPMFHINPINPGIVSLPALLVSLVGAVVLLAVINFVRREKNVKNGDIERKWEKVRNKIHTRWGKLTDQDIAQINGDHDRFINIIQERYGCAKKEAEDQLQRYLQAVLNY